MFAALVLLAAGAAAHAQLADGHFRLLRTGGDLTDPEILGHVVIEGTSPIPDGTYEWFYDRPGAATAPDGTPITAAHAAGAFVNIGHARVDSLPGAPFNGMTFAASVRNNRLVNLGLCANVVDQRTFDAGGQPLYTVYATLCLQSSHYGYSETLVALSPDSPFQTGSLESSGMVVYGIPEPATFALLLTGMALMVALRVTHRAARSGARTWPGRLRALNP
ncbi:MAG TPA: PEP-CTERM sorting domain-containing protein [Albitalea sp.]|uniref:PEP-CTERM sorting domain-containing protein n=1 Tax=Piscinibacter sp. TaxID=1903157 RepID=UPI002ED49611